jgi:hypothetical protein
MRPPFARFTEALVAALVQRREQIEAVGVLARQAARLIEQGGHLFYFLPVHFVIDARDIDELAQAARALLDVQTKILGHLVARDGRDGVLQRFGVPDAMRRFVRWDELLAPQHLMARFDILQSAAGYHFCEFNVDSCVAGAEAFEFMTDYFDALGVSARDRLGVRSPLEDLADFLAEQARRRGVARVVILDWSVDGGSGGKGYFSFETMRGYVARACDPIPVVIADEQTYDPAWLTEEEGPRTLVHRGCMMEEMDDDGRFLDRLLAAGTPVINTYDSVLRMNKGWFALFHDEAITSILSAEERALVTRYIPYTADLTEANLAGFLAQKQAYIFKVKQSFGGAGIYIGDETPADALEALLRKDGLDNWTVQQLLTGLPIVIPHDDRFHSETTNLVFGLYLYGARPNGMLVRASKASRIVNVTSGHASVAWAAAASEAAAAELTASLTPPADRD